MLPCAHFYFTASLTEGSPVAGSAAVGDAGCFRFSRAYSTISCCRCSSARLPRAAGAGLINGKRGQLAQLLLQRNSAVKRLCDGKYCGFQFAHRQVLPFCSSRALSWSASRCSCCMPSDQPVRFSAGNAPVLSCCRHCCASGCA